MSVSVANTTAAMSGKTVVLADGDVTVTGLHTFSRSTSAPFAVNAGAGAVSNLDADKLDGQEGSYYTNATNLASGTVPTARMGSVVDIGLCEGRLTLESGVAVSTSDQSAKTNVYWTPYKGNRVALYDGSAWDVYTFTEKTLALGTLTASLPYDVFVYNNSGTLTLEALAWTSATARATALTTQDGVLVKSGATTRRYLGTFYTTSTTTTEDSATKRCLWNYYHRVRRPVQRLESTATWAYTTATFRQANNSTSNQIAVVVGVAESAVDLTVTATANNSTGGINFSVSIGEDSTSTVATGTTMSLAAPAANINGSVVASLRKMPAVGYHYYAWLEYSVATGTTTWQGNSVAYVQSGIVGSIEA
jgi:hypothetical protein